jgi:hypothetical protein
VLNARSLRPTNLDMEPVAISRDLRDTITFIPTESWEVPGPSRLFPAERIIALGHSFATEVSNEYDEEVAERGAWKLVGCLLRDKLAMFAQMRFNFRLTASDADRQPADLPVVPMQVSLWDIAVLGLVTSMSIL